MSDFNALKFVADNAGLNIFKALEKAYEQGRADAAPKWIPVSERLPDNTDTVLIVHRGGVSTGWYNGRYWERGASSHHRKLMTVTHWMPFPEAPKGEQHEPNKS